MNKYYQCSNISIFVSVLVYTLYIHVYTGILDLKNDSPILRGYKQNLIITFLPNMSTDITGHIPMSHTIFNNFHLFRQYFMSLKVEIYTCI